MTSQKGTVALPSRTEPMLLKVVKKVRCIHLRHGNASKLHDLIRFGQIVRLEKELSYVRLEPVQVGIPEDGVETFIREEGSSSYRSMRIYMHGRTIRILRSQS